MTEADLELHARLRIPPELLALAQVVRVDDAEARTLLCLGRRTGRMDGLIYPYLDPETGYVVTRRLRRDAPEIEDGRPRNKYLLAVGHTHHLYFSPGAGVLLADPSVPVVLVEAEKSVLALMAAAARAKRQLLVVGTGGCWGWRGRIGKTVAPDGARVDETGPLPDLARIVWTERDTIIVFDSNAASNRKVQDARRELARDLASRGALVRIAELPEDPGVNGPDDFVGTHGDGALWLLLDRAPRSRVGTRRTKATAPSSHPPTPAGPPIAPCTLDETIAVFRRWLFLEDPTPVYAVAAALVANRAPGDPVWLMLVCAPSTGKTEVLQAAARLRWVVSAAKVTEASLLSGTSSKERAANATGGLLRQIGSFGVLLCKDFTSTLAQNYDARGEGLAALREVYDGSWDRPVGTDGGQVLSWRGKCGLLAGVTPAVDGFGQVLSALGDRFLLLRLPEADVDAFGAAALRHGEQERQMRHELREALAGLVEYADPAHVNRTLTPDEQQHLIRLAAYTARARTAVVRDGYHQEVQYLPQVEGPGRLVKAYARLLGGLEAIGCDDDTAWGILTRIAIDCAPALRTRVLRELVARRDFARTSEIAEAVECVTKTAARYLEDLSLLRLADRTKLNDSPNSPDYWAASDWLRQYWPAPQSETENSPPHPGPNCTGGAEQQVPRGRGVALSPTFEGETEVQS